MRNVVGFLAAVGASILPSAGRAAQVTVPLTDVTTIQSDLGESRVLFKAGAVRLPSSVAISGAFVTFPTRASDLPEAAEVIIYPVTATWTPGSVDWTNGWSKPGGDVDEDYFDRRDVQFGPAGEVTLDVTSMMQQVIEERMFADGFLLTVPPDRGDGFSASRAADLDIAGGTLTISFRQVPSRSPWASQ